MHRVIKAILHKEKYQLPVLPTPGEAHAKLGKRLPLGLVRAWTLAVTAATTLVFFVRAYG